MLFRHLLAPMTWTEIEEQSGYSAELTCAKILWELPIAFHKAGVRLTELEVGTIPRYSNFAMLCPRPRHVTEASTWDDLSAACEGLQAFKFCDGGCERVARDHFPDKDKAYLDNYLGSILSRCGNRLRNIDLSFYAFCINTGRRAGAQEGCYPVGPLIGGIQDLRRLERFKISNVEMHQAELDACCKKLGNDLEHISMYDVILHDGRWADAVDILRQKATARLGGCKTMLMFLAGGEFVARGAEKSWKEILNMTWFKQEPLLRETKRYLNGRREENLSEV